ncbi:MAG: guanylate kinase [Pseudomonadales bacterium]
MSPTKRAKAPAAEGVLFIVSAPSGAGKTSLVNALLEHEQNMVVCVSHTTREMRPNEQNGVNYHFVDTSTFERMLSENAFFEHAEVFGNFYGTAKSAVKQDLAAGRNVVLEIDWQGAAQIRRVFPQAVSIFILPPSLATLRGRLHSRGQDEPAVIEARLAQARGDISHCKEFDYVVVNDEFDAALQEMRAIARATPGCRAQPSAVVQTLLDELLTAD